MFGRNNSKRGARYFWRNNFEKKGFKELLILSDYKGMKIFQPAVEDQEEGFATSFTFDNSEEQQNFADFLNTMGIAFLKSKFPVIDEGKVKYQTGFVVPGPQPEPQEEAEAEEEPQEVQEVAEKPKGKKKKGE